MTFQFRPHQIKAVDATESAWRRGIKRPLNNMCVGSGKSYTMAELCRRAWMRGERSIILADRRELVEQNAGACRDLGLDAGMNSASIGERSWRSPVISASIQSVFKNTAALGLISNIFPDESHMTPHGQAGMWHKFYRAFPNARIAGFSGTPFRLNGGFLCEGEDAPFDEIVFNYEIVDGIRDEYLVPAFSAPALDKIDVSMLRKQKGEYSPASQDAQTTELIENHIAQMKIVGANRRAWLVFEASVKSANLMSERLTAHGISNAVITEETKDDVRKRAIEDFKSGKIRCLINVGALTTGFDAQITDMLVMRRKTASLGLYIQMVGRLLRTIGGNLAKSIAAGKSDGIVLDFAGNIDEHGPLDFIRPKETTIKMVSCDCTARNVASAFRCWDCGQIMTKVCPGCMGDVPKGTLDCPNCAHDFRMLAEGSDPVERKTHLFEMPSGADLISSVKPATPREGGWMPVRKVFKQNDVTMVMDNNGDTWALPSPMERHAEKARWVRIGDGQVMHLLKMNGRSQTTAIQVSVTGVGIPIPMPVNI